MQIIKMSMSIITFVISIGNYTQLKLCWQQSETVNRILVWKYSMRVNSSTGYSTSTLMDLTHTLPLSTKAFGKVGYPPPAIRLPASHISHLLKIRKEDISVFLSFISKKQ